MKQDDPISNLIANLFGGPAAVVTGHSISVGGPVEFKDRWQFWVVGANLKCTISCPHSRADGKDGIPHFACWRGDADGKPFMRFDLEGRGMPDKDNCVRIASSFIRLCDDHLNQLAKHVKKTGKLPALPTAAVLDKK